MTAGLGFRRNSRMCGGGGVRGMRDLLCSVGGETSGRLSERRATNVIAMRSAGICRLLDATAPAVPGAALPIDAEPPLPRHWGPIGHPPGDPLAPGNSQPHPPARAALADPARRSPQLGMVLQV